MIAGASAPAWNGSYDVGKYSAESVKVGWGDRGGNPYEFGTDARGGISAGADHEAGSEGGAHNILRLQAGLCYVYGHEVAA